MWKLPLEKLKSQCCELRPRHAVEPAAVDGGDFGRIPDPDPDADPQRQRQPRRRPGRRRGRQCRLRHDLRRHRPAGHGHCPEPLRCRPQRIIRQMRIALRRLWLGVAQQAAHDGEALSRRYQMRGVGVAQVVQTHVAKRRLGPDIGPPSSKTSGL